MRYILCLVAIAISLVAVTGCLDERTNMRVVPDRAGHAATNPNNPGNQITNKPQPGPDEMYITLSADDSLYKVAKGYGVTLEWLIKRNDLSQDYKVKASDNLIVPRNPPPVRGQTVPATGATKPITAPRR